MGKNTWTEHSEDIEFLIWVLHIPPFARAEHCMRPRTRAPTVARRCIKSVVKYGVLSFSANFLSYFIQFPKADAFKVSYFTQFPKADAFKVSYFTQFPKAFYTVS